MSSKLALCIWGLILFGPTGVVWGQTEDEVGTGDSDAAKNEVAMESVDRTYWDQPQNWYGAQPISKFLPKNVVRARVILQYGGGDKGYDADGKKVDNGVNAVGFGGAVVGEYGITDRLAAQLIVPLVFSNKVGLDGDRFIKTEKYAEEYAALKMDAVGALQSAGLCNSAADCEAFIDNESGLPTAQTFTIRGSSITAPAQVPLKNVLQTAILRAAAPEAGETGVGDVQIGIGRNFINEGFFQFAVGIGVIAPTGSYTDVSRSKRPTGRGRWSVGTRTFVDFILSDMFLIAWENQLEFDLGKGKRKISKLLEPGVLTEEEEEYERKGVKNFGDARLKVALGMLNREISFMGLDLGIKYSYSAKEANSKGKEEAPESSLQSAYVSLNIDPLRFQIPLRFDLSYQTPIGGKNQTVAMAAAALQIKAFYRF